MHNIYVKLTAIMKLVLSLYVFRCTTHEREMDWFWIRFNKLCLILYIGVPLVVNILSNTGLMLLVLRKAKSVSRKKIVMVVSLSALSIISWLPIIVYGTIFNSTGYHIYLRFASCMISLDTTFAAVFFIFLYPSYGRFVLGVVTCGRRGVLSPRESLRNKSRGISTALGHSLSTHTILEHDAGALSHSKSTHAILNRDARTLSHSKSAHTILKLDARALSHSKSTPEIVNRDAWAVTNSSSNEDVVTMPTTQSPNSALTENGDQFKRINHRVKWA